MLSCCQESPGGSQSGGGFRCFQIEVFHMRAAGGVVPASQVYLQKDLGRKRPIVLAKHFASSLESQTHRDATLQHARLKANRPVQHS